MKCPDSQTLAELLVEATVSAHSETLWMHLEECPGCQSELDRISDDPDLKKWRDSGSYDFGPTGDVDALVELVERLANRETEVRSFSTKSTIDDQGVDNQILASFEPSLDPSDLGMLGPFRIRGVLGHGGMAVVFEAIDSELNRTVALKILRTKQSDATSRDRFVREARALAGVKHPNVISIYSVASTGDGQPFIAMEMIDGGSLQERLRFELEIPPRLAAMWIKQAALGLAAAHEIGLVHRDVKPSNILLANDGNGFTAKLADFGLARFTSVGQRDTQAGILIGTPAYMSPEHIAAPDSCDTLSDIYSLGVTLYELLTGEVPFRGAVHTVLQRIGRDEPVLPRTLNALIPRDLETVCMKAMHSDSKRRYTTAKEFADDLNRWLVGEPILARSASKLELLFAWCKRNKRVATLAGIIASLLIALASVSTYAAFTIQSAARELKTEKETVEESSRQLQVVAEEAKTQRLIAIDALNNLVTKVQTELAERPGTLRLRQSILEVAVKGLDQITSSSNSTDIDLTRIRAHLRKLEIFDTLGRSAESVVELEKATTLAENYNEKSPNMPDVQRVLGDALLAQADIATRRGGLDVAMPLYQRILQIREAAAKELPKTDSDLKAFDVRRAVVQVLQRIGDVYYHRTEWDTAHGFFDRSLKLAKANAEGFANSPIAKRDLSLALQRLGFNESLRNLKDEATGHFQQAVEINRALLAADPENKIYAGDLGYILGTLSKLSSATGDHEAAKAQAKESILQRERVAAADPEDTDAKIKMAMSWTDLHNVFMSAGRLPEAEEALNRFLQLNEKIANENPSASKFSVMSAMWFDSLSRLQVRQGRIADGIKSTQRAIEYWKRSQKAADVRPEMFEPMISIQQTVVAGLELALRGVSDEDSSASDAQVLYIGRGVAMYEAARIGETEKSIELGRKLTIVPSTDPTVRQAMDLVVARAFALCYRNLAKKTDIDSVSNAELKEMVLMDAINRLKEVVSVPAIKSNPSAKRALLEDLDFRSIRGEKSFVDLYD